MTKVSWPLDLIVWRRDHYLQPRRKLRPNAAAGTRQTLPSEPTVVDTSRLLIFGRLSGRLCGPLAASR